MKKFAILLVAPLLLAGCSTGAVVTDTTAVLDQACADYAALAPTATGIADIVDPAIAAVVSTAASFGSAFCANYPASATTGADAATESAVWLGQQAQLTVNAFNSAIKQQSVPAASAAAHRRK